MITETDVKWDKLPPATRNGHRGNDDDLEPTTWEPIDLGPALRGEVARPEPSLGLARSDGLRLLYPGREHVVVGETESGKTWLALACVAAVLTSGGRVVYLHYEEGDEVSTVGRLLLLGVASAAMNQRLRFVAPSRPARAGWLESLLDPAPALVVHDGVNEAMALHGMEQSVEGASAFRRRLVKPCLAVGAASLACDHMPMTRDGGRLDAYGTVHKGNALDGARIALENTEPFGQRLRGASYVYVTKDRPGSLRTHGKSTKKAGKTFMGTLVVDDSQSRGPDFELKFFAPKDAEDAPEQAPGGSDLADTVYDVIAAQPEHHVKSMRQLKAELRKIDKGARHTAVQDAVDDLLAASPPRLIETFGRGTAIGYRAVVSGSQAAAEETGSATGSGSGSLLEREPGTGSGSSGSEPVGTGGNQ